MRICLIYLLFCMTTACASVAVEQTFVSKDYKTGDVYMDVRLHGVLKLPSAKVNGHTVMGLSGVAWDTDENLLYAVNDQGLLFHFRPLFEKNTLINLEMQNAYPLQDEQGKPLEDKVFADSEGMTLRNGRNGIRGDGELLISFERQPRVIRFQPDGKPLGMAPLPAALQQPVTAFRDENKMFEAITLHPLHGLLTAPEWSLKSEPADQIVLYTGDDKQWRIPAFPAENSAVVALEALPDGSVLVMERSFISMVDPTVISIRQVWLDTPQPAIRQVLLFDTSQGWAVDNFEGMTRHRDNFFFIISDDNGNPLQSTLLIYFELL